MESHIPAVAFPNKINVGYVTTKKFLLIISITKYTKYCPMKFSVYLGVETFCNYKCYVKALLLSNELFI